MGKLRLVRKEGPKTNDRRSEQTRGEGKEQWQLPDFKREGVRISFFSKSGHRRRGRLRFKLKFKLCRSELALLLSTSARTSYFSVEAQQEDN
jgi:hypothetical protein